MGKQFERMKTAWLAVAGACDEVRPEWTPQMIGMRIALAVRDAVKPTGTVSAAIRAMCGEDDVAPHTYRDPRVDPRPDDVLMIGGAATQVLDADPDDGVAAHDITGAEWRMSLSDWRTHAARSVVLWQEDAPPPADVSLLALANRTLAADLEAARAEVARLRSLSDAGMLVDHMLDSAGGSGLRHAAAGPDGAAAGRCRPDGGPAEARPRRRAR